MIIQTPEIKMSRFELEANKKETHKTPYTHERKDSTPSATDVRGPNANIGSHYNRAFLL
jgi:hypothetical protein